MSSKRTFFSVLSASLLCAGLLLAPARDLRAAEADDAVAAVASYEFGQSRKPLLAVEEMARATNGAPEQRAQLAQALAALLASDAATLDAKRFVCRQLSLIGSEEQVPALAPLLTDKDLSDMARYALERIPGKEGDKALLEALDKAEGSVRIGIIHSLGQRKATKAVRALGKRLFSTDRPTAQAAASALGSIGGRGAVRALDRALPDAAPEVRDACVEALFQCAESYLAEENQSAAHDIYLQLFEVRESNAVRAVALGGIIRTAGAKSEAWIVGALRSGNPALQRVAISYVVDAPGVDFTRQAAAELPRLAPAVQVQMLSALGRRGDGAALPAVIFLTRSPDAAVRLAALEAMGGLGESAAIVPLAQKAADKDEAEQKAARASLDRLSGEQIEPAMIASLTNAEAPVRAELLRSLGRRNAAAALPAMAKCAREDADAGVRVASLEALGSVAKPGDLPLLLELLAASAGKPEREETEKAILSVCRQMDDAGKRTEALLSALAGAKQPATKASMARILGKVPDDAALAPLRSAAQDPDADVRDAALRALVDWPTEAVVPDLVETAKSAPSNVHRVLAARGYLRLIAANAERPAPQALGMYAQALALAPSDAEKQTALTGIAGLKGLEAAKIESLEAALDDVEPLLATEAIHVEAAGAVLALARAIGQSDAREARAILENLLRASKDEKIVEEGMKAIAELPTEATTAAAAQETKAQVQEVQETPAAEQTNAFFAMHTGTGKGSPAEQADMLKQLGYAGIGCGIRDVALIREECEKRGMRLFNFYTGANIDAGAEAYDPQLKEAIAQLKGSGAAVWLTINSAKIKPSSPEGDDRAVEVIREIADLAAASGMSVALYPHTGSWLERTDDAVRVVKKVDRPNVGATFNLCHWLKVEGDGDARPVLERALPCLAFVTINGADSGDAKNMNWNQLIQTLDQGSYDVGAILKILGEIGYKGPIGLQGYGIEGDAKSNLQRSMGVWREMRKQLGAEE